MKQLAILAGLVLALFLAWLLLGTGERAAEALFVPSSEAGPAAMVRSAHALVRATPRHFPPGKVLDLIELLTARLDDASWKSVQSLLFGAWKHQRGIPEIRERFLAVSDKFVPRALRLGSYPTLEALVEFADGKEFDSQRLRARLEEAVKRAPADGENGVADFVVVALRDKDVKRAADWLVVASQVPGPGLDRLTTIVELRARSLEGKWDPVRAAALWQEIRLDAAAPQRLRGPLEDVALSLLKKEVEGSAPPGLVEGIEASVRVPGGGDYWKRVAFRYVRQVATADAPKIRNLRAALKAVERVFGGAGYESETWLEAGLWSTLREPKDARRSAKFFELALESAPTEVLKGRSLKLLAAALLKARSFAEAGARLEKGLAELKDEALRKDLDALLAEARAKEKDEVAKADLDRKNTEQDRLRGQLQHFQERLVVAREQGRPSEEIHALERQVKDLASKVIE